MAVALDLDEQTGYRIRVLGTGLAGETGIVHWTLFRETLAESRYPVRGFRDRVDLVDFVAYDVEAPLGRPVFYVIEALLDDGTVTTWSQGPVTMTADHPVLSSPVTGRYVDLDAVEEWPELAYSSRTVVIPVVGRPDPVVVSDAMVFPSSKPILRTDTVEKRGVVRSLLLDGQVVLLRAPETDVEDAYVAVTDWVEARVTRSASDVRRFHNLDVVHVAPPDFDVPASGDTLAQIPPVASTLLLLSGAFDTLLELAATDLSAL